jgi:hypothetical protein
MRNRMLTTTWWRHTGSSSYPARAWIL